MKNRIINIVLITVFSALIITTVYDFFDITKRNNEKEQSNLFKASKSINLLVDEYESLKNKKLVEILNNYTRAFDLILYIKSKKGDIIYTNDRTKDYLYLLKEKDDYFSVHKSYNEERNINSYIIKEKRTSDIVNPLLIKLFRNVFIMGLVSLVLLKILFKDISKMNLSIIKSYETFKNEKKMKKVNTNTALDDQNLVIQHNEFLEYINNLVYSMDTLTKRVNQALQKINLGIVVIDSNKNILLVNDYALNLFNATKKAVLDKNIMRLTRDLNIEQSINKVIETKVDSKVFIGIKNRELEVRISFVTNSKQPTLNIFIQDITETNQLLNMKTEFISNISHELKTPLTSIKGFVETMLETEITRDKSISFLNIILEETNRLTNLINELTLLNKIEKEENIEEITIFNPKEEVENVKELIFKMAKNNNIDLVFVNEITEVNIKGNKFKFRQIIINLVENAIKYSNTIDPYIKIETNILEDFILTISDNGVGIKEEDKTRIFERFYQVDKSRTYCGGGSGLGLSIVKHIVNNLNGKIKLDSAIGVGSIFTISLPINK